MKWLIVLFTVGFISVAHVVAVDRVFSVQCDSSGCNLKEPRRGRPSQEVVALRPALRGGGNWGSVYSGQPLEVRVTALFMRMIGPIVIALTVLVSLRRRHLLQTIFVALVVPSLLWSPIELLIFNRHPEYIQFRGWFAYSGWSLALSVGVVGLFGVAGLRALGILSRISSLSSQGPGSYEDPLYAHRMWLLTSVFIIFVHGAIWVIDSASAGDMVSAGVSGFVMVVGTIFVWRKIPRRPPDVLYFRSFQNRDASRVVAGVRQQLSQDVRLASVVDPQDMQRPMHWSAWLTLTPALAFGAVGECGIHGFQVYLIGDWKEAAAGAIKEAKAALFDTQNLTEAVAWEIGQASQIHGGHRLVFLCSPDAEDSARAELATRFGDVVAGSAVVSRENYSKIAGALNAAIGA